MVATPKFSDLRASEASAAENLPDSPTVRVTPNGLVYVDADELVRSAKFRASHEKLKELFDSLSKR